MNKKPLKVTIYDNLKLIIEEPRWYHIGVNSILTNFISSSEKSYIRVKKEALDHLVRQLFQIDEKNITIITDKLDREKINSLVKIGIPFGMICTLDSIREYDTDSVFVILNFTEDDVEVFVDIQSFKGFKGNAPQYRELFNSIFSFRAKTFQRGHSRDVW